jgi:trans-aconitate 2-methyltransferase
VTHAWDAATYDKVSDPQVRMGNEVLGRVRLAGEERVLDAGCGSGRVTEALLERLPRGHVVAVDASAAMLAEARARLAGAGGRVTFVQGDLAHPLAIGEPVDAVLSTATFHWIADHLGLFRNMATVLRPGGQLVAQCGGAGNIDTVQAAIRAIGDDWRGPWTFATVEDTRRRLSAAGFAEAEVWLNPERVEFDNRAALERFLRTVVLGAHLERQPPEARDAYVREVAARVSGQPIDYVRLNIIATR